MADVADGVFSVANEVLEVVRGSDVTRAMVAALRGLAQKAQSEKLSTPEVVRRAREISPAIGNLVDRLADKNLALAILVLLLITTCNAELSVELDIKLDANQLVDQLVESISGREAESHGE